MSEPLSEQRLREIKGSAEQAHPGLYYVSAKCWLELLAEVDRLRAELAVRGFCRHGSEDPYFCEQCRKGG